MRLPLTLAIMDGMSVAWTQCYILPLSSVVESFQVQSDTVRSVGGSGRWCEVRDEYMPVVELAVLVNRSASFDFGMSARSWCGGSRRRSRGAAGGRTAGPAAGGGEEPGSQLHRKVNDVSGATIMGDGRVALILDVGSPCAARATNPGMASNAGGLHGSQQRSRPQASRTPSLPSRNIAAAAST